MKKLGIVALFGVALTPGASGQDLYERISRYIIIGQFVKIKEVLHQDTSPTNNAAGLAAYQNYLGRYDLNPPVEGFPSAMLCETPVNRQEDAEAWLQENIGDTRVVMFNENHFTPASRVYVKSLLGNLKDIGFTHFGIEALPPLSDSTDIDAILTGGQDTLEPTFSALIREAIDLEFELVSYENRRQAPPEISTLHDHISFREQGQARNLADEFLSAPESAKFVLFTGWSHIAEIPVASQGRAEPIQWMASRFKEITGVDPLTIDLTQCSYESSENDKARLYLTDEGAPLVQGVYAEAVDAQFFLPTPSSQEPKPVGFYRSSLGEPYHVPDAMRSSEEPVLVQARFAPVNAQTVAYDRVLMRPGENLPLYLKPGDYEIISYKGDGTILGKRSLSIPEEQ